MGDIRTRSPGMPASVLSTESAILEAKLKKNNTKEDLEDIFLAELIEVNPLRGSSCPLLWTVLSLKGTICLKKGPNLG